MSFFCTFKVLRKSKISRKSFEQNVQKRKRQKSDKNTGFPALVAKKRQKRVLYISNSSFATFANSESVETFASFVNGYFCLICKKSNFLIFCLCAKDCMSNLYFRKKVVKMGNLKL